jgi:uncharacterized protein YrzB (UPF0473 family)
MDNKDIIVLKNEDGKDEKVELILTTDVNNKKYLLYKNSKNEIFASYILEGSDKLYNDLTEDEYSMLENLYKKGFENYDK